MNARFANKKTPLALAEALAKATVPVTKVPARRRGKATAKATWSGSVLVVK